MNIKTFITGIAAVGILFVSSLKGDFFSRGFLKFAGIFVYVLGFSAYTWLDLAANSIIYLRLFDKYTFDLTFIFWLCK